MRGAGPTLLALAVLMSGAALAQEAAPPAAEMGVLQLPFVTLDEARMFAGSAYGKALLAQLEVAQTELAAENRVIEADLARREQELTDRRPELPLTEFRVLADAFNTEVQDHRAAQQAKERAIYQRHDEARLRYREIANQVLAGVMAERGALAILAEEAIVLGFRELDITDAAIAGMDRLIGDGAALPVPGAGQGGEAGDGAGRAPP